MFADARLVAEWLLEFDVLVSRDITVLTAYRSQTPRVFVLVPHQVGQTCLVVAINEEEMDCLPVTVTDLGSTAP